MLHVVTSENRALYERELDDLFRVRKAVFVDELGWQLPVRGGLETDEYDDAKAIYALSFDCNRQVTMAARYRPTSDHSMLMDHFAHALAPETGPVNAPDVWEITRGLCLEMGNKPHNHLRRALHVLAPLELAHARGGTSIVAFSEVRLLPLAMTMGWRIELLGDPTPYGEGEGIAFRIEVSEEAIRRVRAEFDLPAPSFIHLLPDAADQRDVHQRALDVAAESLLHAATLPQLADRRQLSQHLLPSSSRPSLNQRALAWVKKNQARNGRSAKGLRLVQAQA